MSRWYKIQDKADAVEIMIDGEIGDDYWGDGTSTSSKEFINATLQYRHSHVDLYLNSPGGDVFKGISIYNHLAAFDDLTVHVIGLAASIASVIMLAGNERVMHDGSMVMIHNPWTWVSGNAATLRKAADDLDKIRDTIVSIYVGHTSLDEDEAKRLMDEETWLSTKEAQDYGFATSVDQEKAAACIVPRAYGYRHTPAFYEADEAGLTIRDAEIALRDAGFSAKVAKAILSRGYMQRDVEEPDEPDYSRLLSAIRSYKER